ncbi:nuclear transport factor 2 family protein [Sphingomonas jatrophae]|uniref:SnoaL-like domain-containing protein n=1 Tax=Sphingomonas jatrophae TaxID=1166337 RepID=A0A1I6M1L7_9SPHN|nr:nuclear transport factor 2 family protein [Sphingomonas jatrophae]SFS09518.1 SnoaL-like domain-containing protein [Sphingomonas jatrophae]
MSIEERNLEETRKLYALCAAGDWPAVRDMLCDDFFATEAPGLPFEGVYAGRNGLRQLFEKVMGMMPVAGLDHVQMTAGGDWVIVLVEMLARDEAGEFRIPLAEATRFRDGKVAEIKPYYFDPALVHRAVAAGRG